VVLILVATAALGLEDYPAPGLGAGRVEESSGRDLQTRAPEAILRGGVLDWAEDEAEAWRSHGVVKGPGAE
jgi:hypothetical protein